MAKEAKITVHHKGFVDPLLGFDDPLVGYVSFDRFDDPLVGMGKYGGQRLKAQSIRARDDTVHFSLDDRHSIALRVANNRAELDPERVARAIARAEVVTLHFSDGDRPALTVSNGG